MTTKPDESEFGDASLRHSRGWPEGPTSVTVCMIEVRTG
jgi:hypothetical protein